MFMPFAILNLFFYMLMFKIRIEMATLDISRSALSLSYSTMPRYVYHILNPISQAL